MYTYLEYRNKRWFLTAYRAYVPINGALRWDGMGWAALVTQCVNASTEIHQRNLSHPILCNPNTACECTIKVLSLVFKIFVVK